MAGTVLRPQTRGAPTAGGFRAMRSAKAAIYRAVGGVGVPTARPLGTNLAVLPAVAYVERTTAAQWVRNAGRWGVAGSGGAATRPFKDSSPSRSASPIEDRA